MTIKNRPALVKALAEAKIVPYEISGAGRTLQVTLNNERDAKRFAKKVAPWGGFRTGWGGWILRANYVSRDDGLSYCDPASYHHY